jgi:hypothetical protein
MCLDRLYLRNSTAIALMAEEGLFPVPHGLVELTLDGESQGVYLLAENVTEALRRSFSGVTAVIRRGLTDNPGEVKWSLDDPAAALARYDGLLAGTEGLSGAALAQAIDARLSLDQYLRWLAVMTLIGSGDYVDEVFYYALATTGPDGRPGEAYAVAGWDQDDLFTECHKGGLFAFEDPWGLSLCAEGAIDFRLLADPWIYRRYAEAMGGLIERSPPPRFARLVEGAAAALLERFADPAVLAAMRELRDVVPDVPITLEVVRASMREETAALTRQFSAQRQRLLDRLEAYRAVAAP